MGYRQPKDRTIEALLAELDRPDISEQQRMGILRMLTDIKVAFYQSRKKYGKRPDKKPGRPKLPAAPPEPNLHLKDDPALQAFIDSLPKEQKDAVKDGLAETT